MTTGIIELKMRATNNEVMQKNLPNVNEKYLPPYDSDVTIAQAAASLKTAAQSLSTLTANTYVGAVLVNRINVTDYAEGNDNV